MATTKGSVRRMAVNKKQENFSNTGQPGVTTVSLLSTNRNLKHFDSLIGILILMFILWLGRHLFCFCKRRFCNKVPAFWMCCACAAGSKNCVSFRAVGYTPCSIPVLFNCDSPLSGRIDGNEAWHNMPKNKGKTKERLSCVKVLDLSVCWADGAAVNTHALKTWQLGLKISPRLSRIVPIRRRWALYLSKKRHLKMDLDNIPVKLVTLD